MKDVEWLIFVSIKSVYLDMYVINTPRTIIIIIMIKGNIQLKLKIF